MVEHGLHVNEKWPYIGSSPDGIVLSADEMDFVKLSNVHTNIGIPQSQKQR